MRAAHLFSSAVLVGLLAFFPGSRPMQAAEPGKTPWNHSLDDALAQAGERNLPVLAIFTGSDWCPHCRTLDEKILRTSPFLDWAADRVVLLEIDLPQEGITRQTRLERSRVCLSYGVKSFPSVVLIGPDGGKLFSHSGYQGESMPLWLDMVAEHLPATPPAAAVAAKADSTDLPTAPATQAAASNAAANASPSRSSPGAFKAAVATAKASNRPLLVVVSKPGNSTADHHSTTLLGDPDFQALAEEHFVVAAVPSDAEEDREEVGRLLGGAELPEDAVELVVTIDGETPVFSQSGRQPASRVVTGLRRFLTARAAARRDAVRR